MVFHPGGIENQARDLMITRQHFVIDESEHHPAAPYVCFDLELALGRGPDHLVLQETVCRNAGFEFGISRRNAMTADVAR